MFTSHIGHISDYNVSHLGNRKSKKKYLQTHVKQWWHKIEVNVMNRNRYSCRLVSSLKTCILFGKNLINKRTMMVLYRSSEQTDLHTYITVEVSAKFTALNFIAPPPPPPPSSHVFFFLTHHAPPHTHTHTHTHTTAAMFFSF